MLSRLTGGLRPWTLSLEGKLHETQPPASIGVAAQQIGQNGRPLVEPGAFFVDGSYGLRINSWNSLVGVAATVRMRFLNNLGRIIDSEFIHTPNSNRTKATSDFPLGVGFPLNITAFASAGAPLVGQTFVQVQLVSGVGGATTLLGTLLQDYITAAQALAWPGSPIRSSIDGGGFIRQIDGTTPGVATNISEAVPTGARWLLHMFRAQLTADANVANRLVRLGFVNGATVYFRAQAPYSQTAGQAPQYNWGAGTPYPGLTDGQEFTVVLPTRVPLLAGHTIQTSVANMQVGDQWGQPHYDVEEFLEVSS